MGKEEGHTVGVAASLLKQNKEQPQPEHHAPPSKFPLSAWETALASTVALGFVFGLLGVYLTMPDSDYSFLKLPRTLQDLQLLRIQYRS